MEKYLLVKRARQSVPKMWRRHFGALPPTKNAQIVEHTLAIYPHLGAAYVTVRVNCDIIYETQFFGDVGELRSLWGKFSGVEGYARLEGTQGYFLARVRYRHGNIRVTQPGLC